jgi:predicted ATPase
MKPCACREPHPLKRVVLTGGPGAGKTAVLELIRQSLCEHVVVLPEAAGIVFGGGFPRTQSVPVRSAAQRAIFFVQRELEAAAGSTNPAIVLCDRGTVDGAAYWPGPDTLWSSVGVTRADEIARYDTVIHLRTPAAATATTERIRCGSRRRRTPRASTTASRSSGTATRAPSSFRPPTTSW